MAEQALRGRLQGRRAVVTGAGQGIGRATAIAFAEEGAEVLAVSRTGAKLSDLPGISPRITPVALDVSDAEAVAGAIGPAAGPVGILVNCAAWVHTGTILECSMEDWSRSLDQNVTSCYHTIRAVLPGMLEQGRGSIINVASVASSITGVAGRAAYGTSKAALIGLTKAVARDFVAAGVRCNALCPGTTDSPSLRDRMEASGDAEEARRQFVSRQPMGRLGQVEEMAEAALFLASDAAAFMTGQLLVVDGGQTI